VASVALAFAVLLGVLATPSAQAQTFTVVHTFKGFPTDGNTPLGTLVQDSAGSLYGTAVIGGAYGGGIVFKLSASGHETVLKNFFAGKDGIYPQAGLVQDAAGNFYGTAEGGGTGSNCRVGRIPGCGVVFKLDSTGKETVLHSFNFPEGEFPRTSLVLDAAGDLYGTTLLGGDANCNCGTVFKLDPAGKLTVLHAFKGTDDGGIPSAVVRDAAGNLYGASDLGGSDPCRCGVVFKIDTTGKLTALYSFTGKADGGYPQQALVLDGTGNLYGATSTFGLNYGTLFELDTSGKLTVLYSFTGKADGSYPISPLIFDAAGNLYGTTFNGGSGCPRNLGCGTVFKLDPTGKLTVLHSFSGKADGGVPEEAALVFDSAGNLYGTTTGRGDTKGKCRHGFVGAGCGVVFKIAP
jgi:uncharacterized repeat protein (TIGR03803 family)